MKILDNITVSPGRLGALAACICLFAPVAVRAAGDDVPDTMLIVDGSGSMWGKIGQKSKYEIVRDTLSKTISSYTGRMRLGIMTYGHRRRSFCRDVEVLTPVGEINDGRHVRALRSFRPRGKTPIGEALRKAAGALEISTRKSAIVLLADGVENCRQDPCAVTRLLVDRARDLKIHVIAFGLPDARTASLQCIAGLSNGLFLTANDAASLQKQVTAVFSAIAGSKPEPVAQSTSEQAEPATDKIQTADDSAEAAGPGVKLAALLSDGGAPLDAGVNWTIYALDGRGGKKIAARSAEPAPEISLAPGEYLVQADFGTGFASTRITIAPEGLETATLILNAGKIALSKTSSGGGAMGSTDFLTLYSADKSTGRGGRIVGQFPAGRSDVILPAGNYYFHRRSGAKANAGPITVRPGETLTIGAGRRTGAVTLSARAAIGSPVLGDMLYVIYRKAPGDGEKYAEVLRSAAARQVLTLAAGEYAVIARHGQTERRVNFQVTAGRRNDIVVLMDLGRIDLKSKLEGSDEPLRTGITYVVYTQPPDGTGGWTPALRSVRADRSIDLPAGTYRIVSLYGNANAQQTMNLTLAPGDRKSAEFDHRAGTISLRLAKAGTGFLRSSIFWRVSDQTGKVVLRSSLVAPEVVLAEGSYQVAVDYGGRTARADFAVGNGETQTVTLRPR